MKTVLIALLFGFPFLGTAADNRRATNWVWELPGERQSFTGLLKDPEFRKVIQGLENGRLGSQIAVTNIKQQIRAVTFNPLNRPSGVTDEPPRHSQSIEAAEMLNGIRMNGYREHCEQLKSSVLQGTPALYPTQIPFLTSP